MKIPLQKAYQILEDSSAFIINDHALVYAGFDDLTGEEDNEFLYFSWDEEGLGYSLKFREGDNQEVEIVGSSMFLYDTDANGKEDHTQITILVPKQLET
jgi:hypothetical protein